MSEFDAKAFSRAKFEARVETVEVPEMSGFNKGEALLWKVRGLTADEFYRVRGVAEKNNQVQALIEAAAGRGAAQIEAIREAFGLAGDLHEEHVRRLEMLIIASVDPKVDRPMAVKFAGAFPVAFARLTDMILSLTGMGQILGKSKGSGETPVSETP